MHPDTLPADIADALKAFTLTQAQRLLTQPPDLIVLADPGASAAGAGLYPLLDALATHFAFTPPIVIAIESGYGAYYDLLATMQEDGLAVSDTVTHQGVVVSAQRRYLRRALRAGRDVGRLTPVYAELAPLLATRIGHRPGSTLHVPVLVDTELPEDPRLSLVKTVVHAAAPSTCRVVFTVDVMLPASGFWQAGIISEACNSAFVAQHYDRQDRFDPDVLAALDAVIAERVRAATVAWLPEVIERVKRETAG